MKLWTRILQVLKETMDALTAERVREVVVIPVVKRNKGQMPQYIKK